MNESDHTVNLSTTIREKVVIIERVRDVTFPKLCNVLFNVKCTVYKLGQNCFKANEVRNETNNFNYSLPSDISVNFADLR